METIKADYDDMKEFVIDDRGYFLIRINRDKNKIEVGFCPEVNKVAVQINGKDAGAILKVIKEKELISRVEHAAYLGRELEKAQYALQNNLDYVQDDELKLR